MAVDFKETTILRLSERQQDYFPTWNRRTIKPKKLNRGKERILQGYIIIYLFIYLFIIFAFTDLVNTNNIMTVVYWKNYSIVAIYKYFTVNTSLYIREICYWSYSILEKLYLNIKLFNRESTLKGYHTIHMLCTGVTNKCLYQELFYSIFLVCNHVTRRPCWWSTKEFLLEEFTWK